MDAVKRIGLVAHDNRKKDLIEWAEWNYVELMHHELVCTGTTGTLIEEMIVRCSGIVDGLESLKITKLKSGPLGGDQQLGSLISDGRIDLLFFLWDPMEPQPHDVDVKALLRIATLYNIPTACNRSTADFLISSPLMSASYKPVLKDYAAYIGRNMKEIMMPEG